MRQKNKEYFSIIQSYIQQFFNSNGYAPTVREIESGTGISKSTVSRYLAELRENGFLNQLGHRYTLSNGSNNMSVPLVGSIACGNLLYAEEHIEEYISLPVSLFGKGNFFILRADGDSMIEAGINDGDLILIRQANIANESQIIVALVDDEATLKRYYPEPEHRRIRLHPENPTMDDIYVDHLVIQGVAVKVLKDID